jgi:hypothetical protein
MTTMSGYLYFPFESSYMLQWLQMLAKLMSDLPYNLICTLNLKYTHSSNMTMSAVALISSVVFNPSTVFWDSSEHTIVPSSTGQNS